MSPGKTTYFAVIALFAAGYLAVAAEVPVRSRVVDVIILDDGTRLLGVAKEPVAEESISILLRSSWLRRQYPMFPDGLVSADDTADESVDAAIEDLSLYLKSQTHNEDKALERRGFVNEQIERLRSSKEADPDFVLLEIPSRRIRRRFLQSKERRALAFVAVLNDVPNVETAAERELRRRVKELPQAGLVTSLPDKTVDTVDSVDRIIINADRLFGRVSRIIKQGNNYISESNAGKNVTALAGKLLADEVQQQVLQLLDENGISGKAKAKQVPHSKLLDVAAARIADDEDADVVEVTSMQMNPAVGTTEVSISVYRRRSDKRWHEVMVVAGRAMAGDVTAEQRQRIEKDPQVQQVFRLFSSLGATSQLSNAIGVGAVVEIAQQRAKSRLNQLLLSGAQRPVFRAYVLPANAE